MLYCYNLYPFSPPILQFDQNREQREKTQKVGTCVEGLKYPPIRLHFKDPNKHSQRGRRQSEKRTKKTKTKTNTA